MDLEVFSHRFHCNGYQKVPLAEIQDEDLQDLLKIFTTLLPVHADASNLDLYRLLGGSVTSITGDSILLTCSHFEDAGIEDMAALLVVMHKLAEISTDGEVSLNLLSTHGEKLILEVLSPTPEIIQKFKEAG